MRFVAEASLGLLPAAPLIVGNCTTPTPSLAGNGGQSDIFHLLETAMKAPSFSPGAVRSAKRLPSDQHNIHRKFNALQSLPSTI
jgi:hypothetical protein